MKKFFTLIAVALCALTVSAKETLPNFTPSTMTFSSWTWNNVATLGGGGATDNGDGTADVSALTYYDGSAYDYIIIEYSAATIENIQGVVQYDCNGVWGQWGAEFNNTTVSATAKPDGGYIAIKLNAEKKNTLYTVALQDKGSEGTMDVKDAYFASEQEYKDLTGDTGDQSTADVALTGWGKWGSEELSNTDEGYLKIVYPGAWGGANLWLGSFDASEYDYLVAEIEPTDIIAQLFVQYANAPTEEGVPEEDPQNQTVQAQPGEKEIIVPLYASVKNEIKQIAMQNSEAGTIIIKKLYWKSSKSAGINDITSDSKAKNNVRYNLLGVKNGNGIYIMNGKKYMK